MKEQKDMVLGSGSSILDNKSANILVTGGVGYIGDAVIDLLLSLNYSVTVVDNLLYGGAYMRGVGDNRLTFVNLDITNKEKLLDVLSSKQWRAIIHLAAIVGDGACSVNPERTIDVNENATKTIAEYCAKTNTHMVFASTCSVYGANNDILDERSPTNPLSLYAGTKLAAEKYVREVTSHVIFRLGTVFGISSAFARLRCDLIANILTYKAAQGQPLSVFGGEQWRPMVHVLDVAHNLVRAAIFPRHTGTFILSHENYRVLDIAKTVQDVVRNCEIRVTEMKFEDQRNYKVDNSLATTAGFVCQTSLAEGIVQMHQIMSSGRIADVWSPSFHNEKYLKGIK